MKNTRVARRYAAALMSASVERNALAETTKDLELIAGVLKTSREFRLLMTSPIVSVRKKTEIVKEGLGRHIGPGTLAFVTMLIAKRREQVLSDIIEAFGALHDQRLGIVNVDVKTAVEFTSAQEKDLLAGLERYTKKKVRIRFGLDSAIKGGLVIRIGDTVLDASVRRQLELLRARFVTGDVH
jgi:F-type H+-transporting ATPase subunit delta